MDWEETDGEQNTKELKCHAEEEKGAGGRGGSHRARREQLELNGENGGSLGGRVSGRERAVCVGRTVMTRNSYPIEREFGLSRPGGYTTKGRG